MENLVKPAGTTDNCIRGIYVCAPVTPLPQVLTITKELTKKKENQRKSTRKYERYFFLFGGVKTLSAAAAAKSLQSCPTLCDPIDGSPPGSPVPGFSRQEHWSGLPFPSPMHESEKWKGSCSVVSDSMRLHRQQPTRLLCPWDFPGKSTGVGCHCLLWKHCLLWGNRRNHRGNNQQT